MKQIPSPNFTEGRGGKKPEIVVIHVMAGSMSGTAAWFQNPKSQVSAHYGIGLNGEVVQYVQEKDTAWANGRVQYPTSSIVKAKGGNPNTYSISIEHEGNDLSKGTKEQWDASVNLIDDICKLNGIPKDREHIIGHYEIFSGKPNCPATDKSIIDKLINNEEPMNEEFAKAVGDVCGEDYGKNLNDGEQKEAAKKLKEVKEKLGWCNQLEITNARLLENNGELSVKLTEANKEIESAKATILEYTKTAGTCEPELNTCKENLRIQTEKANNVKNALTLGDVVEILWSKIKGVKIEK